MVCKDTPYVVYLDISRTAPLFLLFAYFNILRVNNFTEDDKIEYLQEKKLLLPTGGQGSIQWG